VLWGHHKGGKTLEIIEYPFLGSIQGENYEKKFKKNFALWVPKMLKNVFLASKHCSLLEQKHTSLILTP
jgi:hypothetical protein